MISGVLEHNIDSEKEKVVWQANSGVVECEVGKECEVGLENQAGMEELQKVTMVDRNNSCLLHHRQQAPS